MSSANPPKRGGRQWVYAAAVKGRFNTLHRQSGRILVPILLLMPWIRVAGRPVFLVDLSTRNTYLMGAIFTPRDSVLLFCVVAFTVLALFFFTTLFGRVWCGYACPQTVFLEEFVRRIERVIEGDRGRRRKFDQQPWTPKKVGKKLLKWSAFALLAIVFGFSLTGFFVDIYDLVLLRASAGGYVVAGLVSAALFVDFAWFREQFCNFLCPYARFQSAMTDKHSVTVGYDYRRGEPRLTKKKRKPRGGLFRKSVEEAPEEAPLEPLHLLPQGDCVNCMRCVNVCPQGIDIRDGYQLECISCALCIDACTDVMGRLGKETLVRYDTEAGLAGEPKKFVRPRPIFYAVLMLVIAAAATVYLMRRVPFDVLLAHSVQAPETRTAEGGVRNLYELTLVNQREREARFQISLEGLDDAALVIPAGDRLNVPSGGRVSVPMFVTVDNPSELGPMTPIVFVIESEGQELERSVRFRNSFGGTP